MKRMALFLCIAAFLVLNLAACGEGDLTGKYVSRCVKEGEPKANCECWAEELQNRLTDGQYQLFVEEIIKDEPNPANIPPQLMDIQMNVIDICDTKALAATSKSRFADRFEEAKTNFVATLTMEYSRGLLTGSWKDAAEFVPSASPLTINGNTATIENNGGAVTFVFTAMEGIDMSAIDQEARTFTVQFQ